MNSRRRAWHFTAIGFLASAILASACSPKSGGRSSALPEGADVVASAPTAQGTVSGGGGNGCEGKAFEAYAQKITNFTEYRLYIQPILRRMIEGGNDPLASYLTWVAEEKVWYFIPCQLERLSKEQIGLAIDSDQLARHSEHGIYIYGDKNDDKPIAEGASTGVKKHYFNQRMKARAALLLHEMVMGARLLMKKSAKDQCKTLARMEADLCANQELMAIAETVEIDPLQMMVMNADDHEAVRAMTAYLAERGADVSAEKVWQARQRFKFHFPWDRAVSRLELSGLAKAFARSFADRDVFYPKSATGYLGNMAAACTIHVYQDSDEDLSVEIQVVSDLPIATTPHEKIQEFQKLHSSDFTEYACMDSRGRVVPEPRWKRNCDGKNQVFAWRNLSTRIHLESSKLAARGVLKDGVLVDEIVISQPAQEGAFAFQGLKPDTLLMKLYVTRGARPKIDSIVVEPKGLLRDGALQVERQSKPRPSRVNGDLDGELYDLPGLTPLECRSQAAAAAGQPTR